MPHSAFEAWSFQMPQCAFETKSLRLPHCAFEEGSIRMPHSAFESSMLPMTHSALEAFLDSSSTCTAVFCTYFYWILCLEGPLLIWVSPHRAVRHLESIWNQAFIRQETLVCGPVL